ncbi:MAG: hypothetical protein M1814_002924 [Vezdaea aestivalis]|nr:MAG: hypothetical protein M1814_002924 [Vezdaea aestivalis]
MEVLTPRRQSTRKSISQWNPSPSKTRSLPLTPQPPNILRRPWDRHPVPASNPALKGKKIMKRRDRPILDDTKENSSRGEGCWVLSTPDRGGEVQEEAGKGKRRLVGDALGPVRAHWTRAEKRRAQLPFVEAVGPTLEDGEGKRGTKRKANGEFVRGEGRESKIMDIVAAALTPAKRARITPKKQAGFGAVSTPRQTPRSVRQLRNLGTSKPDFSVRRDDDAVESDDTLAGSDKDRTPDMAKKSTPRTASARTSPLKNEFRASPTSRAVTDFHSLLKKQTNEGRNLFGMPMHKVNQSESRSPGALVLLGEVTDIPSLEVDAFGRLIQSTKAAAEEEHLHSPFVLDMPHRKVERDNSIFKSQSLAYSVPDESDSGSEPAGLDGIEAAEEDAMEIDAADGKAHEQQTSLTEDSSTSTEHSELEVVNYTQVTDVPAAGNILSEEVDHHTSSPLVLSPGYPSSDLVKGLLPTEAGRVEDEQTKEPESLLSESITPSPECSEIDLVDETLTIDVSRYLREDTLTVDVHATSSSPRTSNSKAQNASPRSPVDYEDDDDCSFGSDFFTDSMIETSQLGDDDGDSALDRLRSPGESTVTFDALMPASAPSPAQARLQLDAQSSPFLSRTRPGRDLSASKFTFSPALQLELSPSKIPLPPSPPQPPPFFNLQQCLAESKNEAAENEKLDQSKLETEAVDDDTQTMEIHTTRQIPLHDDETASLLSFLDRVRNSRAVRLATNTSKLTAIEATTFLRASLSPQKESKPAVVSLSNDNSDEPSPILKDETSESTPTKRSRKRHTNLKLSEPSILTEESQDQISSQATRRSKRSCTACSLSTKPPMYRSIVIGPRGEAADSNIPAKSFAQELALITRANTRRNRGNRETTAKIISALTDDGSGNEAALLNLQILGERTEDRPRARKSVVWDEALVYFQVDEQAAQPVADAADCAKAVDAQIVTELLAASPAKPPPESPKLEEDISGTRAPAKKAPKGRNGMRGTPARRRSSLSFQSVVEDLSISFAAPPSNVGDIVFGKEDLNAIASGRRQSISNLRGLEPVLAPGVEDGGAARELNKMKGTRSRLPAPTSAKKPESVKRIVGGTPAKRRGKA